MLEEKQLGRLWENMALTKLFRSFPMAVAPTKLSIAFLALVTICLSGWVMDMFSRTVIVKPVQGLTGTLVKTELDCYIYQPEKLKQFIKEHDAQDKREGVFSTLWTFGARRFNEAIVLLFKLDTSNIFANVSNIFKNLFLCVKALIWAFRYHTVYSIIYFSIILAAFSLAGGAICRCAALEFSLGEKPGIIEALMFSRSRFTHFIRAPLLCLSIIAGCSAVIFCIGLLGNIPHIGPVLTALGLVVSFPVGLLLVFMLTGTILGAQLMFPAIAYEDTNSLDALGRSFMYVFRQPLWLIIYDIIGLAYGTVSYLFIRFFAFFLLLTTHFLTSLGMSFTEASREQFKRVWPSPEFFDLSGVPQAAEGFLESITATILYIPILIIVGIVAAYVISYSFCVSTITYSLLRNKVDNVSIEEISTEIHPIQSNCSVNNL